jgi:hypothetical protein
MKSSLKCWENASIGTINFESNAMAWVEHRHTNPPRHRKHLRMFDDAIWAANAAFAAQPQTVRLQTTCMQLGHMTTCD